jgi:hypothetical protein
MMGRAGETIIVNYCTAAGQKVTVSEDQYDNQKDIFKNGKYYNSNETAYYEHAKYNWKDVCMNAFTDFRIYPERLMIKLTRFDRDSNIQNKVDIPSVLIA